MKTCPTCHRTYSDETISFCLEDGALLSASSASPPTQSYPQRRETDAPPTQVMPHAPPSAETIVAPPPIVTRDSAQTHHPQSSGSRWPIIVGAVGLVVIVGVITVVVAALWLVSREGNNSSSQSSTSASPKSTPTPSWTATPENRNTSNSTFTPAPPSPSEPRLEMSGTWVGTFDEDDARLIITYSLGNTFTGNLSGKTFEVIVEGDFNPETRAVRFRETRVIRDKEWVLGTNSGTMSADGQTISGSGRSEGSYTWNFRRE